MKTIIKMTILLLAGMPMLGKEVVFKAGSNSSPYGPEPEYVKEIASQFRSNPQRLYELKGKPLEDTFELLSGALWDRNYPEQDQIAREVFYQHPDLEDFLQRTVRKIVERVKGNPPLPLDSDGVVINEKAIEMQGYFHDPIVKPGVWSRIRGVIQSLPSAEMKIRLLGPCLNGPVYVLQSDDWTEYGIANQAADLLAYPVKTVTGEVLPSVKWGVDVEAARAWWAKNEEKYAWKPAEPPAPRPSLEPTTPQKRVLLNSAKQNEKPSGRSSAGPAEEGNTSEPRKSSNSDLPMWIGAIVLLLAAFGVGWKYRSPRK